MVIAYVPLVFAIVGALIYAITEGKPSEAGRITFAAGMFALAYAMATHVWHIG